MQLDAYRCSALALAIRYAERNAPILDVLEASGAVAAEDLGSRRELLEHQCSRKLRKASGSSLDSDSDSVRVHVREPLRYFRTLPSWVERRPGGRTASGRRTLCETWVAFHFRGTSASIV
jgi:hypothetical protein